MLISTKPDSIGKKAVIYRSRQLTEFKWTPVRDVPVHTRETGKTKLCAGEEKKGMLYSSTEPIDKFIGENISFETFLSVIANPDSALYNKDINGHNNSWAYFGLVCNGLARYSLNIRRRYSTKRWPDVPGMRKIADEGSYTAEQIELCDVICMKNVHVALITDILRNESGEILQIEVSEAIRPLCVRRQFDLETFFEKYKHYDLWRYDFVDMVPMPDEKDDDCLKRGVPDLPAIAVDYGNKTNYRTYEDVVISVFAEEENQIEIYRGDQLIEKITVSGRGKVLRKFDRGYYTVKHINSGKMVEFCVTMPQISYSVMDGRITVKADSCDPESKILYMDFREKTKSELAKELGKDDENKKIAHYSNTCASLSKIEELSEEEKETGVFTRDIPKDAANFKVYFENKYGVWTHTMIRI